MRVLKPLLLAACMFVTGCGKAPATEAPASKPAAVSPATTPAAVTKPIVTETPVPKGPPILTLRASGAILDPDGTAFASRDDVEKFLKSEQLRTKATAIPIRGERDVDAAKVRQLLVLYQRAGFRHVELREAGVNDRKAWPQIVLPTPKSTPKKSNEVDPTKPDEEELKLPTQITLVVKINGTGTQANQVREILLKTPAGETGFGRSEWRERLPVALKALVGRDEVANKDACDIQADGRLCYEGLLEVVELCGKAGLKHIEVAAFAKKPGESE